MAIATTNGQVLEAFSRISISHPLMEKAHQLFDDLRESKRRSPNQPMKFGALFAPSLRIPGDVAHDSEMNSPTIPN